LLSKKKSQTFSDLTRDNFSESRNANIDMNNLMDDINQSRDLYKKLSGLCHPDRFVNTPKEKIAEIIFQEISKHKRNFEELSRLKERAIKELNIEV
jgi:cell division protein YceG involved in septum cleavage